MIAFDNSAHAIGTSTTSLTFSHTVSGDNRIIFVSVQHGSGTSDRVTGVTYAGVSMTRIDRATSANEPIYLYYLIAPDTGANNVVISVNTSTTIRGASASYTGALQSGVPDSSGTNTTASATSLQKSITTVLDNCWLVVAGANSSGNDSSATDSGAIQAQQSGECSIGDSNGAKTPAGSHTGGISWTGTADACLVIASFAPATVAATYSTFSLMGVG